jgi:hypothetical protein
MQHAPAPFYEVLISNCYNCDNKTKVQFNNDFGIWICVEKCMKIIRTCDFCDGPCFGKGVPICENCHTREPEEVLLFCDICNCHVLEKETKLCELCESMVCSRHFIEGNKSFCYNH